MPAFGNNIGHLHSIKTLWCAKQGGDLNKIYIVVLDGGADRPIASLGGRTPLEAAHTPCLDHLAKEGRQGMIDVIASGICPESDSGAMALLSYDPLVHYTGRGPLEGLGAGFLKPGESSIAFRINFASYDASRGVLDRRTSRDLTENELQTLAAAIRDEVDLRDMGDATLDLVAFRRHRGIVCFRSTKTPLSGRVSNTDPGYKNIGSFGVPVPHYEPMPLLCKPLIDTPAAQQSAELVNTFVKRSAEVLERHPVNKKRKEEGRLPANMILCRDGGDQPLPLQAFTERFGRSISMYGQIPAERGLAMLIGGNYSYSWPDENQSEEDYLQKAADAVLQDPADTVFIHLKGPDEPGHDGEPQAKVAAIEMIDKYFMARLVEGIERSDVLVVTCDHATPCDLGRHSDDKVPLLIHGKDFCPDGTQHFGERFAAIGNLPVYRGMDVMPFIIEHLKAE